MEPKDKGFTLEWSRFHQHNDGLFGRDTIIRNSLGKAVGRIEPPLGEPTAFKTYLEPVELSDATIMLEKDYYHRVKGFFDP